MPHQIIIWFTTNRSCIVETTQVGNFLYGRFWEVAYRMSCSAWRSWFDFLTSISTKSISRFIARTSSSFSSESFRYFSQIVFIWSLFIALSCSWKSISYYTLQKLISFANFAKTHCKDFYSILQRCLQVNLQQFSCLELLDLLVLSFNRIICILKLLHDF